jgi:type II secretory pathway pseudopilin PulG
MRCRRGVALVLALVVILLSTAVASAALATARSALQRAAESQLELRDQLARESVRATAAAWLSTSPAATLSATDVVIAAPDTVLRALAIGQGWYRISIRSGSREVSGEIARTMPWVAPCEAVITRAPVGLSRSVVASDPSIYCADSVRGVPAGALDSLLTDWERGIVSGAVPDTLDLSAGGSAQPEIWRARSVIRVAPGALVTGIVWAPVVEIAGTASVRGLVLASAMVRADPGATILARPLDASAAWARQARAHLFGRRGLLSPP